MNFSQCYYTSIGGWNATGSPELSDAARQLFASDQAANAPRNQHYLGRDGKPLVLSEIISDGRQAVVSRSQYGLLDQRGRPNMFAHGYCHVWDKAMTVDPAPLCFLTPGSFAASREQVDFAAQPEIRPLSGFTAAFQKTDLLWKHFAVLTLAVYAVFEQRDASLYVVSECEGEALQALIYCIYLSVPYSIRKSLSFTDAALPGAKPKTIVFCKPGEQPQGAFYFSLLTGENNVVTKAWMTRNKKNRFMRLFGSFNGDTRAQQYFADLDARLQLLGKPDAVSYRLLYLADTLMLMDEGGNALPADGLSLVYLMASVSVPNAAYLDGYLAKVIQMLSEQKVELGSELNELVLKRMQATENPQLIELRMQFKRKALLEMPIEQAGVELLELKKHMSDSALAKREFNEAQMFLFELEQGRQIIGVAVREDYLQLEDKSYASLADAYSDCEQLGCASELIEEFTCTQAYELFCRAINQGDALDAYQAYTAFLHKRFDRNVVQKMQQKAKARYWELFDLSTFSPAKVTEYQELADDEQAGCQKAKNYARVLQKLKTASEDDTARLYLSMLKAEKLSSRERDFLVQQCRAACMGQDGTSAQGGSARIRLAHDQCKQKGSSILREMHALGVSVSPAVWQMLLNEAPCFFENGVWNEQRVTQFIQAVQKESKNTDIPSEKQLAQGILSAYQVVASEKKQLDKLANRAQNEAASKNGQFSGFGSKLGALMGNRNSLTLQSDPSELARTQEIPTAGNTVQQPDVITPPKPAQQSEVIYSGRNLEQMNAPILIDQNYEHTAQPTKKKKWSDLLKWHK